MLSIRGVLFVLNAFCVTLAIGAMGYAFSLYIKTRNVLGAFTNVFALGTCFICGAFVPQDLLSKGMLTFARVFPNYYYVVNNNRIGFLTELTSDSLTKIFINMLIQLLFALAFMIASIFISKKQMTSEN
jgi:ABC-2 type transport system permease protein